VTVSQALALRPATSADVKRLAVVLARAFYDDPPLVWMLPDPETRLRRITRVFRAIIGIESLPFGGIDVACGGGEIVGGAVWMPPGHPRPGFWASTRTLPVHTQALAPGLAKASRFGRALSDAHPKEPHWYLKMIGVDPSWQGRGVASLLLRSRLKRCDQEGQPAYLEASKPEGVLIYEHFGFQRKCNLDMPEGAPVQTTMWRPPAP
jgi:GNAT superfamily N-acetyltransferase